MTKSTRTAILLSGVVILASVYMRDDERCLPFHYDNKTMNTCDLFSSNYTQARDRFRSLCPIDTTALSIVGDSYTTDICVVPGNSGSGVVVHLSGVHGIEGYAGSAIQLAWLLARRQTTAASVTVPQPTVILVHAVNPHGMAHYRRTNENNVDLNRNALTPQEWGIVQQALQDHGESSTSPSTTSDPLYTTVRNQITVRDQVKLFCKPIVLWKSYWPTSIVSWGTSLLGLALHGMAKLKRTLVAAQYNDPTGVFYGGDQLQPSLVQLRAFLTEQFLLKSDDDVVTMIDVHTGLGRRGDDTLLFDPDKKDVCVWFAGSECVSEQAGSVSSGYEGVRGFVTEWLLSQLSSTSSSQAMAVVQEFGTLPSILVGNSLVLDNAALQAGLKWGERTTKRSFYPAHSGWRAKVLTNGLRLLQQAMDRSQKLSRSGAETTSTK